MFMNYSVISEILKISVIIFQLRLAIIEAVGHMTHLIGRDKLEEQLPRLLQGILGLYKRHPEPYHITQVCYQCYFGMYMLSHWVCPLLCTNE